MPDMHASARPDAPHRILVCPADPGLPIGPVAQPGVLVLSDTDREALFTAVEARMRAASERALLIVGSGRAGDAFRIQTRAENRAPGGRSRLSPTGPGVVRATASATEMARVLADAGHRVEVSSEAEDDAASQLLYRALCAAPDGVDAPAVALLRVPTADQDKVKAGIASALHALAMHLPAPPRGAVTA